MGKNRIKTSFIVSAVLLLVTLYVIIWSLFVFTELFPTGKGISKSDWLLFIGSFLSFAGTMLLGFIAINQASYENKRIINQRHLDISPVFVITPTGTNIQLPKTAKAFSLDGTKKNSFDNFHLIIKNEGKYPIRNIFIFDVFLMHSLIPSEERLIVGAFKNSKDLEIYDSRIICFDFDNCNKASSGYPDNFYLSYEDIDGGKWYQYFTLDNNDIYYEYDRMESI